MRRRRDRLSTEEYEHVAAKTYKLISEHPSTDEWIAEAASTLSDHVIDAKRPLNYVAIQYLQIHLDGFFALGT